MFIVSASKVRKNAIRVALRRLQFSRGLLLGSVLTRHELKRASYGYDYDYGYGYGKVITAPSTGAAPQLEAVDKAA
jgi:hypothetical protein